MSPFLVVDTCTFESAPVATLMETYMLEQMLECIGFKQGEMVDNIEKYIEEAVDDVEKGNKQLTEAEVNQRHLHNYLIILHIL
jgi:t-SNARE complex subunit (syntaxin)